MDFDLFARQETAAPLSEAYLAQSRAPIIISACVVIQVIGTIFFLARVWSRAVLMRIWKQEDWALFVAWLFGTGYSICVYGQVKYGAGKHIQATSLPDAMKGQEFNFASQLMLVSSNPWSKFSICLTYLRIFYSDRRSRIYIYITAAVVFLAWFPFMVQIIFQCRPLHVFWTEFRPADKCLDNQPWFYTSGALTILSDIALIVIVVPRILALQLHPRQKYVLIAIVMMGWLVVVAGIIRIVRVGVILKPSNTDPSWSAYDAGIWTSTEIYVSIMCASAPSLKPLVSIWLPSLLGKTSLGRSQSRPSRALELSDRLRQSRGSTLKSNLMKTMAHKTVSETHLTEATGPISSVVAKSADEISLESVSARHDQSGDRKIYKRSDIVISTDVR